MHGRGCGGCGGGGDRVFCQCAQGAAAFAQVVAPRGGPGAKRGRPGVDIQMFESYPHPIENISVLCVAILYARRLQS